MEKCIIKCRSVRQKCDCTLATDVCHNRSKHKIVETGITKYVLFMKFRLTLWKQNTIKQGYIKLYLRLVKYFLNENNTYDLCIRWNSHQRSYHYRQNKTHCICYCVREVLEFCRRTNREMPWEKNVKLYVVV